MVTTMQPPRSEAILLTQPPAQIASVGEFATDHLLPSLKVRTVSSGIATGIGQAVQLVLNLAAIVILARLLTPRDFGLVALVSTITGFLRIFNDAGLSTVTIQKEEITHAEVSNLFWTNLACGAAVSALLAALSPVVAWFYHEPQLVEVTLALSLTFVLTAANVQHLALLKRQMRFKAVAVIQVSSTVAGLIVGILMARLGQGHWCLVGMQLAIPIFSLALTWSVTPWRPQRPMYHSGTRALLAFGANLTASSFVWSLARGTDALLIGTVYGIEALGLYSRGSALLIRPLEQAMSPLEAVLVPTLSRLRTQPERCRRTALRMFAAMSVTGCFVAGLLLALASPLTTIVLGAKWQSAAPIFAAFTLVAIYVPLTSGAGWLLASQGRGKDFLILSTLSSCVTVLAFLGGLRYGLVAIALVYSLSSLVVHLPLAFYIAGRNNVVSTRDLWSRTVVHLPVWGIVFGAAYIVRPWSSDLNPFVQVLTGGFAGLIAGAAFISIYAPSRAAALDILGIIREWKVAGQVIPAAT